MEEALFQAARAGDTEYLTQNQNPRILSELNPQGDTACHVALQEGYLQFVFLMARIHPPILCQPNAGGDPVLHCVLKMGVLKLFSLCVAQLRNHFHEYIDKDFYPDGTVHFPVEVYHCVRTLRNAEGKSLVYMAAENGYDEAVRTLMNLPLLRRTDGPNGSTAMHVVVHKRNYDITQLLLEYKPDIILCQGGDGNTALHLAVMLNDKRMVELLVKESCGWQSVKILNKNGYSPFHLAATMKYLEINQCLLSLIPEAGVPSKALHDAVRERYYDIAQVLLVQKSDIVLSQDGDANTALHLAVMQNDHRMVELLVKGSYGTQSVKILNNGGHSPFHLATTMNDVKIFQFLLQVCPECYLANTTRNQNLLHLAVREKAAEIVKVIVKDKRMAEYMINQQDNDCNTPLHIAASYGNKRMLNTLSTRPVMVRTLKNKKGLTFISISNALEARKVALEACKRKEKQKKVLTATDSFHSSLLLMATLIATVTFTAAFTMPGGYENDGQNKGMATLAGRADFIVFLAADAISICCSMIATAMLVLLSVITNTQNKFWTLMVAISSIVMSVIFMLVAFAFGVWVVIGSESKWLAILIAVGSTSCALLVLALAFKLIVVPSESEDAAVDARTPV